MYIYMNKWGMGWKYIYFSVGKTKYNKMYETTRYVYQLFHCNISLQKANKDPGSKYKLMPGICNSVRKF